MSNTDTPSSIGLLGLRVGAGVYMATHGWSKVMMVVNGEFERFGDPLGIGKTPSLIGAAGAEFVCALAVALGLFTRFTAVPVVFTMLTAAFLVHGGDPWMMGGGASKEPALLYATMFLALVFLGGGRFSLDHVIRGRKSGG